MQRIEIPESVLKVMTKMADGRRNAEVEMAVDKDGLTITLLRTGEMIEWSRKAYEASKNKVKRSLV